ncbi:MAG: acyl carrier protein [Gammaproteobacteria bacterium]|nr:acyl carrier protein [Gammaproteobacteria bacterium]
MTPKEQLRDLLLDVLLLDPSEFRFDLTRDEIPTWDSMAVVAIAVGVDETFGYHFTPEEATAIRGIQDIMAILQSKGIAFAD